MPVQIALSPDLGRASVVLTESPGNILTASMVRQLRAALEDLIDARHLRLLSIEGAGRDFSFGASVPEHTRDEIAQVLPDMHALIVDLLELPVPTAAVVRGRCLGGGFELALACDFVFAADDAVFGLPEIALGVFPPAASVLLPRRVGAARATSAILTGTPLPASRWREIGLVELVAPAGDLAAAVDVWFEDTLGRKSAEALRQAVRVARAPIVEAVARELPVVERLYLTELMLTHDANEGVAAFLEKRNPQWKDR